MKIKVFLSIFAVSVCLSFFCSCSKGENDVNIVVSPTDKSIFELATTVYNDTQLTKISEFTGTMNELNARYPIECIREFEGGYQAIYLGNQKIVELVFDSSGDNLNIWGNSHNMHLLKSDFDALSIGQSLSDVKRIDPDGDYTFLYIERDDVSRRSIHYTTDGYLISFEFDDSKNIISIYKRLI